MFCQTAIHRFKTQRQNEQKDKKARLQKCDDKGTTAENISKFNTRGGMAFSPSHAANSSSYNTLDKNSLSLGFCGFPKNSFGAFSSRISPPSINITRLATFLANSISCVTITIVIF